MFKSDLSGGKILGKGDYHEKDKIAQDVTPHCT